MPVLSIVMQWRTRPELILALRVATAINVTQLRARPLPPLYSLGLRYQREVCRAPTVPGACERFVTAHQAYAEWRAGTLLGLDCDDLACWRAAELIVAGERAVAFPVRSSVGWHVIVVREDGNQEDPSRILGMKV